MKYKTIAIMLLFFLLNSCNSSAGSVFKEKPTETPLPTSTATPIPTNTPLPTPTEKPSPVLPVVASASEGKLTKNGLSFYVVAETLEIDLYTTKCSEESKSYGYMTYTADNSICFYTGFYEESFPIKDWDNQSGKYLLVIEKGSNPRNEGQWALAVLDSSYLSDDVKRQLKAFDTSRVDSPEEWMALNQIVELPKELIGWNIIDIYPLSNEQVEKLYNSDLLQIK
jgi:hypothetical protein